MEPLTLGAIFTALLGAISTLFGLYTRELMRQLAKAETDRKTQDERHTAELKRREDQYLADVKKRDEEIERLEAKVESQSGTIAKNTEALTKSVESQEKIAALLADLLSTEAK